MSGVVKVALAVAYSLILVGEAVAVRFDVVCSHTLQAFNHLVLIVHRCRKDSNFVFDKLVCFLFIVQHHFHQLVFSGYELVRVGAIGHACAF